MQIVVTGNQDSPDALVSIEGMNLKEFECLVTVLKEKYTAIEEIYALDNNAREFLVEQIAFARSGKSLNTNLIATSIQEALDNYADQYQLIYKFLKII